ncbi:di-heme oxidoredictase family protein [Luteimonas vadosa]
MEAATGIVASLAPATPGARTANEVALIGDGPALGMHLEEADIAAGRIGFDDVLAHGEQLFTAKFNRFDGQGRPAATGTGVLRDPEGQPVFLRTSGPDANACSGCHNDPFIGGAGEVVANVFVLAQALEPVTESVSPDFSNERNTLGMQGSGAIEMLAREMSGQLHAARLHALARAQATGLPVRTGLLANGISFGALTARPDGSLDTSEVAGVDADLVVRPFHQKGAVVSLREFSNNAMNHHHGMQSVERFGTARTGSDDHDADGIPDELSVGDITALTLYQAALATPGQVFPDAFEARRAVLQGERSFDAIGCSGCHVPAMTLRSRLFTEPNPFNPPGNLRPEDVDRGHAFDLTRQGELPRLEATRGGGAVVRAYTDLKRHDLCDDDIRHYCNERVKQAGIATELFLTRKLWDVGNSAPYGHRGDLTTLTDAILAHGGEARAVREAYRALPPGQQAAVVEFLKSLQMLPPGTRSLVVDSRYRPLNKDALAQALGP